MSDSQFILNNPYPITATSETNADLDDFVRSPMHEQGDMIFGGSAGYPERLIPNITTTPKILSQVGTGSAAGDPEWIVPGADNIANTPSGTIEATDVQGAIDELNTDAEDLKDDFDFFTGVTAANFVTYSGATQDLNLGTRNISTSGSITAGEVVGVVPYTGAIENTDLGNYNLQANMLKVTGVPADINDVITKQYLENALSGLEGLDGTPGVDGLAGADGADGSVGTDARTVDLTSTKIGFIYNTNGVYEDTPATATITATVMNSTGDVYYQFFLNDSPLAIDQINTYIYTPPTDYTDMPQKIEVQIREGSISGDILARDQISLYGVKAGTHGASVFCDNLSDSLPADVSGNITDYALSETNIIAFHGSTPLPYDDSGSPANLTFRITSVDDQDITAGSASTVDTYTRHFGVVSGMTGGLSTVKASITYYVTIKDEAGVERDMTLVQTFNKSLKGATGAQGAQGIQGIQGNPGSNGGPGPAVAFQGDFDPGKVYYNNALRRDVVKYAGVYWIYNGTNGQAGAWSAGNWESFGSTFESVATSLLFAETAYVDNLGVREFRGAPLDYAGKGSAIAIENADIYEYVYAGDNSGVLINMKGYNGGLTKKRGTVIGNGTGGIMGMFQPDPAQAYYGVLFNEGAVTLPSYGTSAVRNAAIPNPQFGMMTYIITGGDAGFQFYTNGWHRVTLT